MKKLLTGLLLIIGLHSYSQCNCPNFEKEGKSITVCDIKPIAYDNSLQVGISYGKISTQPIVSMTIRYRSEVKNVNSNMTLTLSNGTILEIPLQKSGLAYIGNSQVCQAIFTVTEVQKSKLKLSPIRNIGFSLNDGLFHTLDVQLNKDILQSQIKCL